LNQTVAYLGLAQWGVLGTEISHPLGPGTWGVIPQ